MGYRKYKKLFVVFSGYHLSPLSLSLCFCALTAVVLSQFAVRGLTVNRAECSDLAMAQPVD